MPVAVREKFKSRSTRDVLGGKGCSATLLYLIDGTTDETAARAALKAYAQTSYDSLPVQDYALSQAGFDFWDGVVTYGAREPREADHGLTTFDTTGGMQRITVSLEVTETSAGAPDIQDGGQGGAINVTPDGDVEGLDIRVPQLSFQRTHIFAADDWGGDAYVKTLADMTGTTNDDTFFSFAAGELLFLGASGAERADGTWEVTFGFAAEKNRTNIAVGALTVTSKKGHQYLEVRYKPKKVGNFLVQVPQHYYVHTVYEESDFADLAIGGTA